MTQTERRTFLIQKLLDEQPRYRDMQIPQGTAEQKRLLRSLMNVRMPRSIGEDFLAVQDKYLREEITEKGITDFADLLPLLRCKFDIPLFLISHSIFQNLSDVAVNANRLPFNFGWANGFPVIDTRISRR